MLEHRPCCGVPSAKINPRAKVNAICHMSVFVHAAFENACAMPKSSFNMGNCICHMLTYIDVTCTCDMQYLICCMFYMQRVLSWSIYDISIMFCNKSENFYVVSKNPFVCFNSFVKGAKIALCVNFCCVQFAMLYLQKHSSGSRLFMLPCKIMWHCQIQLLTFTIELFSDIIKYSWNWFSQIKFVYFWLAFVAGTLAQ